MSIAKAHIQYKNKSSKRVPGVTTILGVLAKPALKYWANKLGLANIEVNKYVDILADAGTLAHKMVECYLSKNKCDTDDYSKNNIGLAENAMLKFHEWEKQHEYEVIFLEKALVSELYQFGGTIDIYWKLDGILTLTDIKTSKAIYDEQETQAVAYKMLLEENGYKVEQVKILRIGRDENEGFEDKKICKIELHKVRFKLARQLYEINKDLKRK